MQETLTTYLEPALAYFQGNRYLEAAAVLVAAVIAAKLADFVLTRIVTRLTRRTPTDYDDRLIKLMHRPIFMSVLLIGAVVAVSRLGLEPGANLFFTRVAKTIAVFIWWSFLAKAIRLVLEILVSLESRVEFIEPRTVALFDNAAKILIAASSIYAILVTWDVDVSGFLVSAGVLGLALGLAAKDTLANLFSGIFIIADAPYKKGDFINLDGGERGMVTDIGLRSTRLLTRDDVEVTVPNAVIGNAKIINESGGPWLKHRLRVRVGVAYGSDLDEVERVLMDVALGHDDVCRDPAPRVRFRAFGDSSLDLELLAWVEKPVLRGRVLHELNCAVYKRFNAEGIEIPFPQRDVHIHQAPAAG